MAESSSHNFSNFPSTSSGTVHADEGVISVDVSKEDLVDSIGEMCDSSIPPDLIMSTEGAMDQDDPTRLTLAYENLYELPRTIVERFADHIRYLDISHNKITNLDALVHFKHLTSLIADSNPITENCFLPPLPKLELLWLNHCKIASLYPWVGKLKESCPNLQYLCLMGNPAAPSYLNGGTFYEYLQYRLFVISQFPTLNHLDDRKVTEDQQIEAQRLYKRPFLERLVKPGSGGLNKLVNSTVSWGNVQGKLASILGKDRQNRNLLI
ncbi:leucine-rich melanocyte differentiation-associated protein-like isoform X1 [Ostrinia furnacalis]|uniref:leucine-rich melanocyte differentiation-associated protein-like isoform X1 n=2 Tax=Ostrinia furnacalis TaxID=93504 RepID=UPI0010388B33|nr:leucine-rich melanocyte differentiation-associated protein-like isoform X1 [Ostrinia furnacalis]